jgi:uncharacterized cupin superfamily protein
MPIDIAHLRLPVTLGPAPINPDWIVEGQPIARATEVSRSGDGTAATMVWECTRGKFDWYYAVDETLYILDGGFIMDEGTPHERRVQAGDMVFFPAGSHARWNVETYVRKVAFLRRTLPTPIIKLLNLRRWIRAKLRGQAAVGTVTPGFGGIAVAAK